MSLGTNGYKNALTPKLRQCRYLGTRAFAASHYHPNSLISHETSLIRFGWAMVHRNPIAVTGEPVAVYAVCDNGSVRGSEAMFSVFRFTHSQLKWVLCKSNIRLLFLVSAFIFIL